MSKIRIPSTGYYFDWQTHTLYMTYRFSVKANNIDGDEYNIYDRFSTRFPSMRVVVEAPPKRKSPYITYDKIGGYIACQDNAAELMAELNKVIDESRGQSNPRKFVDTWFREKFPEFGKYPTKAAS